MARGAWKQLTRFQAHTFQYWALWPPSPSVVRHVTEERLLRVQKPAASRLLVPHCGRCITTSDSSSGPSRVEGGTDDLRSEQSPNDSSRRKLSHLLSNSFQRSCPPNSGGFCRRRRRRRRRATNVTTSRQRQCTLLALFGRCEIDAIMDMLIFELSRVTSDGTQTLFSFHGQLFGLCSDKLPGR